MEFELLPGPQLELFSARARAQLASAEWTVSPRSDRTGFRLEGPALDVPDSIRSEPVLPGSFQIPGNGLPIVTMVDGPTVGAAMRKLRFYERQISIGWRNADLGRG